MLGLPQVQSNHPAEAINGFCCLNSASRRLQKSMVTLVANCGAQRIFHHASHRVYSMPHSTEAQSSTCHAPTKCCPFMRHFAYAPHKLCCNQSAYIAVTVCISWCSWAELMGCSWGDARRAACNGTVHVSCSGTARMPCSGTGQAACIPGLNLGLSQSECPCLPCFIYGIHASIHAQ